MCQIIYFVNFPIDTMFWFDKLKVDRSMLMIKYRDSRGQHANSGRNMIVLCRQRVCRPNPSPSARTPQPGEVHLSFEIPLPGFYFFHN